MLGSAGVQTVWLGYQLYVAFAMHAYRYLDGDICCSIQETIGNALLASEGGEVCLHREGDYVLTARLSMTAVDSVAEGRSVTAKLMGNMGEKIESI